MTPQAQMEWYAAEKGQEKLEEQVRLAKIDQGKCVCNVRKAKKRWEGTRLSTRTIHERTCPKFKRWMEEADL